MYEFDYKYLIMKNMHVICNIICTPICVSLEVDNISRRVDHSLMDHFKGVIGLLAGIQYGQSSYANRGPNRNRRITMFANDVSVYIAWILKKRQSLIVTETSKRERERERRDVYKI